MMEDVPSAFSPVPADELERWALAAAPGWLRISEVDVAVMLRRRIDELRASLKDIEAERDRHFRDARREGLHAASLESNAMLEALRTRLERRFDATLDHAVDAVLAVAESVLGEALATDPDRLRAMLAQRLEGQPADTIRAIRVAPQHAEHLASHDPDGHPWRPDPTLDAGDAVVELSDGQLDLRLNTVLRFLRGDLRSALDIDRS